MQMEFLKLKDSDHGDENTGRNQEVFFCLFLLRGTQLSVEYISLRLG